MFYQPEPPPPQRGRGWLVPVAIVAFVLVDAAIVAMRPWSSPPSAPSTSDATKTALWYDSITVVWGDQGWYDSISNVYVRNELGTVVTSAVGSADEICSRVAISVYDDDAEPIGISDVLVVDASGQVLASCRAR